MKEKSMEWDETPISIMATNPETARFISDAIDTYNELIHYLYYNMKDDLFLKIIRDGLIVEKYIKCIIQLTLNEWIEDEKDTKKIHLHETKIVMTGFHDIIIKCHEKNSPIVYYKTIELSHNKQTII
ncbi:hypothetical protein LGM15_09410 [Klebsiella pneumoniae]|uniref:hypothetical protein n=1 Tax=Enterobacterales TaxID=91347 RepID=UPI0012B70D5C|nr:MULTISPECIES: hypothetical protein [Enterobacterales]MDP8750098.1 hypothetical protein [Serratia marcescens]UDD14265.1 hypothetical protein LGM15_09410 [Klebsiella pneumoniae]